MFPKTKVVVVVVEEEEDEELVTVLETGVMTFAQREKSVSIERLTAIML